MTAFSVDRERAVQEAHAWIGTPYHHRACVKGVGVDCAHLLIGVFHNIGLIEKVDTGHYPIDWHLHQTGERFASFMNDMKLAAEIDGADATLGDIVLFRYGRAYSHCGIMVGGSRIVHAYRPEGGVVEGDMDRHSDLKGRERRYFSCWAASYGRL